MMTKTSLRLLPLLLLTVLSICQAFLPLLQYPNRISTTTTTISRRFSFEDDWLEDDDEDHDIYWLEDFAAENEDQSLGEAIGAGEAVVCIPDVASREETLDLFQAGLNAVARRDEPAARGRSRFSVSDPEAFSSDVVLLCDEILCRVLDHLDDTIPSIFETL
ncbi:expressed unknown protein (Partial), partial [Seminavis robusta]|eukprot:Sro2983_g341610.1 n/a (161) ;mRNA; f:9495-9977